MTLMSRTGIDQPVYSFLLSTLDVERGRLRLGWMDGVKVALGNRGMTVEAASQCAKDRKE